MYEDIINCRNDYQRRIYNKVAELERAKATNAERNKIMLKKQELDKVCALMDRYIKDIKLLLTAVDTEDRNYKNQRIDFIDSLITDGLARIFPQDGLKAHLDCDFNRKNEAVLYLTDNNNNELDPDICSGKLQQYLICFTAVIAIIRGLGITNLYVDEAFGVAAPDILGDLGQLLYEQVDDGMQVIIISQNPGLYQDIPRREIHLKRDSVTKSVSVIKQVDY